MLVKPGQTMVNDEVRFSVVLLCWWPLELSAMMMARVSLVVVFQILHATIRNCF